MHPYNDTIVVTIQATNNLVKRVIVDNGSVFDILYKEAFDKMSLGEVRTAQVRTPLFSFTGQRVITEGNVTLPLTFGRDKGPKATYMLEFLVVDKESMENAKIGRPMLNKIWGITSTYHLRAKFLTEQGIAVVERKKRYLVRGTSKGRMNLLSTEQ